MTCMDIWQIAQEWWTFYDRLKWMTDMWWHMTWHMKWKWHFCNLCDIIMNESDIGPIKCDEWH